MAEGVSELVVKVTPQGVSETSDQLDDMSESFEESSESVGESAGFLSDFSEKFKGAAGVVLAGLATVTAGLLSQVPVIDEAMSGLFSIFDALILRLDERLRPAINKVTTTLFDIADAILEAEGPLGTLIDIVLLGAVAFGLLAGAVAIYAGAQFLAATAIGATVLAAAPLLAVLAVIALAIGVLAVAWQENWFGIRDIAADAVEFLTGVFEDLVAFLTDMWNDPIGTTFEFIELFLGAVGRGVNAVRAVFEKFWARIRTGFEILFDLIVGGAKRWANTFVSIVESAINTAIRAIPGFIRTKLGLSTVSLGSPFTNVRSAREIAQAGNQRLSRRDRSVDATERDWNRALERQLAQVLSALQNSVQETTIEIDGRTVAESQERFLGAGAAGMGRLTRGR